MKLYLLKLRDKLFNSFWFQPILMALLAGVAAFASIRYDHALGSDWLDEVLGWVWSGGAEGARSVLSVIAGSLMTVVSIVFSLTISTLAQVSSHFGPRVLRQFTSDRVVQFTLGIFIATFVYCLLVLRSIRSADESLFIPYLSVNIGMALALASLAVLIFYIHHIARIIQAEPLVAGVGQEIQRALNEMFPESIGHPSDEETDRSLQPPDEGQWRAARAVYSTDNGYLQVIDDGRLMELAVERDMLVKLIRRPGEFVTAGSVLAKALPIERASDEALEQLQGCFSLGAHRMPDLDALYLLQQLVEIAARALSPGINEPFTALICIDWLGAALRNLAVREMPVPLRQDAGGTLRVVTKELDFEEILQAVFDQIRIYGAQSPEVMSRLLGAIADIASAARRERDRRALADYAHRIGADAEREIANADDRARVSALVYETLQALERADEPKNPRAS
ncbi:MAG: DUF2254 domain-containing protein [Candidatus Competibacteraceae bacterium]|nr:DUF2254 domain-containing protein [Candidatus Competibacteraceae bacterium]